MRTTKVISYYKLLIDALASDGGGIAFAPVTSQGGSQGRGGQPSQVVATAADGHRWLALIAVGIMAAYKMGKRKK